MSYRCSECKRQRPEGEKPMKVVQANFIIIGINEKVIGREKREGRSVRQLLSVSSQVEEEIVAELLLCPDCSKGRPEIEYLEVIDQSQDLVLSGVEI